MITPTFVLILVVTTSRSVAITAVPGMIYEETACHTAGEMWKTSGHEREYFCLPTPTVGSVYLDRKSTP